MRTGIRRCWKMRNVDEILKDGNEKELREMKAWLFREEFRLSMIREELDELRKIGRASCRERV